MPFVVGGSADNPQYEFLHWNYYPLFESNGNHTINKNTGLIAGRFVNSIDTITAAGIKKTILLSSSSNSRTIATPALISLNENRNTPEDAKFSKKNIPVAVLLEGNSLRYIEIEYQDYRQIVLLFFGVPFKDISVNDNKIIIVADGDMVLNDISPKDGPLPMGLNFYTLNTQYEYQFANRDFLLNCLEYLVNKPGIIETRNKDIVLRLLDTQKVKAAENNLAVHQYCITCIAGYISRLHLSANTKKKVCSMIIES
jgi:gliding-associated putative ABC transporter substrate-binding component GldG